RYTVLVKFLTSDDLKSDENAEVLAKAGFEAKQDSCCFLHERNLLVCGVEDDLRSAIVSAVKSLKSTKYTDAKMVLKDTKLVHEIVEGIVLGGYEFNEYKSEVKEKTFKTVYLTYNKDDFDEVERKFLDALIVANATNFTRDIVNQAPQELNPTTFAQLAKKLADDNSLECEILGEDRLKEQNMGAMLAVGRASIHDSQLIHLTYKPKNAKKIISLVGKGLTYDSGGLSLKPATSMVTMKMDKAGACAVLGIIKAVSELKVDAEVHVFIGAVENMIGGNAYKPDDVLVSKSGKTIEVRNTDAEGRLVLADVLTYAQENVEADMIFDFATLTGACMVALGQYTTGIMGHSSKLKHDILRTVSKSGELAATLPFNKHLKKLLKSEIADISNVSSKPYGGAITAGLFLDNFIKDENKDKWLHFDIAGSAYTESAWDCNVYGGTGAGVRFMSNYISKER
ncbi:MAG: leucyl aminopeptidase, partial [Epsilonproteobacteria bacterium]|nr:leucyl aminopeptidase [Campylobacterota bacterium]